MRSPEQIARKIFEGKDKQAKKELEKMFGCRFEEMTVKERRLGVAALSAFDGIWNK